MLFYETFEVILPITINENKLKEIALNYKNYLKEYNLKDNLYTFDEFHDDTYSKDFFDFLWKNDYDFTIKDRDSKNIYRIIQKYM